MSVLLLLEAFKHPSHICLCLLITLVTFAHLVMSVLLKIEALNLASLNSPLSSSSTTSHELLSQFSTCSG